MASTVPAGGSGVCALYSSGDDESPPAGSWVINGFGGNYEGDSPNGWNAVPVGDMQSTLEVRVTAPSNAAQTSGYTGYYFGPPIAGGVSCQYYILPFSVVGPVGTTAPGPVTLPCTV